jgi:hypothetical protein
MKAAFRAAAKINQVEKEMTAPIVNDSDDRLSVSPD